MFVRKSCYLANRIVSATSKLKHLYLYGQTNRQANKSCETGKTWIFSLPYLFSFIWVFSLSLLLSVFYCYKCVCTPASRSAHNYLLFYRQYFDLEKMAKKFFLDENSMNFFSAAFSVYLANEVCVFFLNCQRKKREHTKTRATVTQNRFPICNSIFIKVLLFGNTTQFDSILVRSFFFFCLYFRSDFLWFFFFFIIHFFYARFGQTIIYIVRGW